MQGDAAYLGDAVAATQQGDLAEPGRMAGGGRPPSDVCQDVARRLLAFTKRDHDHGAKRLAATRVRDGGVITDGVHAGPRRHPAERVAWNPAALQFNRQRPHQRIRADAHGGDDASGFDPGAVRKEDCGGRGFLDADSESQFDPAMAHPLDDPISQPIAEGRQNPREDVDGDHAQFARRNHRIGAERGPQKFVGFGGDLHTRVAGTGNDERQATAPLGGIRRHAGGLQHLDQVVAQVNEVANRLGLQRVLGQARKTRKVGDRAERDHQVIRLQRDLIPFAAQAEDRPPVDRIERLDFAGIDRHPRQDLPQWDQGVLRLQHAGDDLRHQAVPDLDVFAADQRDVERVCRPALLEEHASRSDAGMAAAQDEHPPRLRH